MTTFTDIRRPIADEWKLYEKAFDFILHSDNPLLDQVLTYIHTQRGKQLRPLLVLLAAKLCKGITDKSIDAAIALELLHTASLIHDDVVDASPLRRGTDSVKERWTNKVAVLVGDYMLAQVIQLIARIKSTHILQIVSQVGSSLSTGELLQLHNNRSMWISEEQYYQVIEQKTARLFAACTEIGAESSGTTMRQASALREYGLQLGICFQLKDDVLDYSDSEELGKPTMSDIADSKATMPLLIALQRAGKEEAEHIRMLAEELAQKAPHIDHFAAEQELKSFVLRYDGIRYAYQQMQIHKQKAIEALNAFHDSESKRSLVALLDLAIMREK